LILDDKELYHIGASLLCLHSLWEKIWVKNGLLFLRWILGILIF
jgi:hypothetical protein